MKLLCAVSIFPSLLHKFRIRIKLLSKYLKGSVIATLTHPRNVVELKKVQDFINVYQFNFIITVRVCIFSTLILSKLMTLKKFHRQR